MKRLFGFATAILIFSLISLPALAHNSSPSSNGAIIFLTADWCGTCRELAPVVERAVKTNPHFELIKLDSDSPNAPDQASKYGISLNGSDLPQVYMYKGGKTKLLYNGRQYHFGHTRQVEDMIHTEINAD